AGSFSTVHLVVSRRGREVAEHELGIPVGPLGEGLVQELGDNADRVRCWDPEDMTAPFASGSAPVVGMAVVPCSMGTAGRIACGVSNDLITRAADVMLKERRTLVLVPRETPLNVIHLRNLLTLAEAGAVVVPAMPPFYHRPQTVEDLVRPVVERALRHFEVEIEGAYRWGE
ncbi:MAG: UbiX family flavin prenyltransferase, partial [Armatimonadota bacterium]